MKKKLVSLTGSELRHPLDLRSASANVAHHSDGSSESDRESNEDRTRQLLDILTNVFETDRVYLVWTRQKDNRGRYQGMTRTIKMDDDCWFGWLPAASHEFAHHLHHHREMKHGRGGERSHGPEFVDALVDVVQEVFGEKWISDYPWENEYKMVIRSAASSAHPDI